MRTAAHSEPEDAAALKAKGVAGVYTPKDFDMNEIMSDMVSLVAERHQRSGSETVQPV